jgi:hypothetical protein
VIAAEDRDPHTRAVDEFLPQHQYQKINKRKIHSSVAATYDIIKRPSVTTLPEDVPKLHLPLF